MKKLITLITIILFYLTSYSQTFSERLILTDNEDSLYLKSESYAFDKEGNYCFVIKQNGQKYFVKKNDTIGGFKSIVLTYNNGRRINYTISNTEIGSKPFYYKNANGLQIYGPAIGKFESIQTCNTIENVALTTTQNDSVYYYINGKLVSQNHKEQIEMFYINDRDWVSFSENGNTIYSIKQDSLNKLFVNGQIVDSSKFRFTQMAINDKGSYIYAAGNKPEKPIGRYDYMFYIHTNDTTLDYVRTVWDYELKENGAYYYSGDDTGLDYIVINNILNKKIDNISKITLIDKKTYLYFFDENGKSYINVSGKIYLVDYDNVTFPTLDKNGNFAYYGESNYYLYKIVNGEKMKEPLSKYGVRATPLYISPKGESLHYFGTDDSIYLYRDDMLIFEPISKKKILNILPYNEVLPHFFIQGKTENVNSLFYMEYDNKGYFVYNGNISESILPFKAKKFTKVQDVGAIITGTFNDCGYFAIQKVGERKYLVIINNQFYKLLDDVDEIVSNNYFFDGNSLTFYLIKNNSFYQFNIIL